MAGIVGIDVGGTFTDLYYSADNLPDSVVKVPSTPQDPSSGLMQAACRRPTSMYPPSNSSCTARRSRPTL